MFCSNVCGCGTVCHDVCQTAVLVLQCMQTSSTDSSSLCMSISGQRSEMPATKPAEVYLVSAW